MPVCPGHLHESSSLQGRSARGPGDLYSGALVPNMTDEAQRTRLPRNFVVTDGSDSLTVSRRLTGHAFVIKTADRTRLHYQGGWPDMPSLSRRLTGHAFVVKAADQIRLRCRGSWPDTPSLSRRLLGHTFDVKTFPSSSLLRCCCVVWSRATCAGLPRNMRRLWWRLLASRQKLECLWEKKLNFSLNFCQQQVCIF